MKDSRATVSAAELKAIKADVKREEREFYSLVAKRIRTLREAAGLSQTAISDIMGLTRGAVTDWEKGKTKFSIPALRRVAAKLDTTVDFLLNGTYGDFKASEVRMLTRNQVAHLLASKLAPPRHLALVQ